MKITKETLQKIAHLARLEVRTDEEEALLQDLSEILTWVEQLDDVDTEGVEPLTHMTREMNAFRKDEAEKGLKRNDALLNSPKHDDQFFVVPKVIKKKGT